MFGLKKKRGKRDKLFIIILFCFLILLAGCEQGEIKRDYSMEDSKEIAKLFILNSPTYSYDGNALRFRESNTLRCDNCFIFIFKFASSYPGYGDRSNQILTETITDHLIGVVVQKGEVVQAVIDNEWDEIKQRYIKDYELMSDEGVTPIYYCTKPRPANCEEENEPVCSSDKKDYSSGCSACLNKKTKWYTKGACRLGYTQQVIDDLNKGKITKESGPVLILWGWELE